MGTPYTWANRAGGIFDDQENWSPNGIPDAQDSVTFDVGATYTVSGDGTAGYVLVDADDVTFTGSIDAAQLSGQFTAFQVGGGGAAVFDGPGAALDSAAEARIGDSSGSGSLSFFDGATGTLTATDSATALDVAFADESGIATSGTVSVDGLGSALTLLGGAYIGTDGAGTLAISNHGLVQLEPAAVGYTSFEVGDGAGATGLVTVTSGGTLDIGEYTVIGDAGDGTIDFSDGATGSFSGLYYDTTSSTYEDSYAVYLGGNGGSGTLSLNGANTSVTADQGLLIGQYGTGVVSVTNGATLTIDPPIGGTFDLTDVGTNVGASGTLIVSGAATVSGTEVLVIGAAGYGSLDVTTGGRVYSDAPSGDVSGELGAGAGGVGVGVIDDGLWDAEQSFSVGYQGSGTLTVQDGGTLEVDGTFLRVARDPGSDGTLTVDGATVSATGAELTVGPAATADGDGSGGAGLLEIEDSSTVDVASGLVGGLAGGTGSIDVTSDASLAFSGDLTTGAGTSTITAEADGGIATNGSIEVGGGGGSALVELTDDGGLYDYGSGGVTLGALGTLELDGSAYLDAADGVSTAPLTLDGGTFDVLGDGALRSGISLDVTGGTAAEPSAILGAAGADVVIAGGISFEGTAESVLLLGPGYDTGNAISNLGTGDTLDVRIGAGDVFNTASYDVSTDMLYLSNSADPLALHIVDDGYSANSFVATPDGSGGTDVYLGEQTPCYCRGTLIRTERGEVPVEELAIGDRVVTRSGALEPIRWIGRRSYAGRFLAGKRHILPVRIRASALAENVPCRDLRVSPNHAMYLDGALVPAGLLVNGVSIIQEAAVDSVEYFHIELADHDVVWAEGAPAETFIDDDSRGIFHNADEYGARYPDAPAAPALFCAPRLESGYALQAICGRLAARAGLAVPGAKLGELRGFLDEASGTELRGWAQDPLHPEAPVCLDILVDGVLVAQTLANRFRADLKAAGLGSGRHGFGVRLPLRQAAGALEVRRSADAALLARTDPGVVALDAAA